MNKRIEFCPDGENETVGFFVVEETRIAGVSYLLVTESEDDEEAEAYILKDLSEDGETEARYVFGAGGSVKDFCGAARGC